MAIGLIRTPRGRVIQTYNYCPNPKLGVDATGYGAFAGTGGTVSSQRKTDASFGSITTYWAVAWSKATTDVSGGMSGPNTPVVSGRAYVFKGYVFLSRAQRLRAYVQLDNNTVIVGDEKVVPAQQWTLMSVTIPQVPTGTGIGAFCVISYPGSGASVWGVNDLLAATALQATVDTDYPYFDGSTGANGDYTYAWTGTAEKSSSSRSITDPATYVIPQQLADKYQYSVASNNTVHQLLNGDVIATVIQGGKRTGTLKLFFLDRPSAVSCAAVHGGVGVWRYDDSDNPEMAMYYVVTPGPIAVYQSNNRLRWIVEVPFSEVTP